MKRRTPSKLAQLKSLVAVRDRSIETMHAQIITLSAKVSSAQAETQKEARRANDAEHNLDLAHRRQAYLTLVVDRFRDGLKEGMTIQVAAAHAVAIAVNILATNAERVERLGSPF